MSQFLRLGKRNPKCVKTADEAAAFFGVAVQSFRKWIDVEGFPRPTDDGFNIWDIAQWKYEQEKPPSVEGDIDAKTLNALLDARLKELKLARLSAEVIEVSAVEQIHADIAAKMREYFGWLERRGLQEAADKFLEMLDQNEAVVRAACERVRSEAEKTAVVLEEPGADVRELPSSDEATASTLDT
jgi:hypothetical protein